MKNKIVKFIAVTGLSLTLVSSTFNNIVEAKNIDMNFVKKYNTNESIYLRNNPIQIPTYNVKQEEQFRGVWVSTVFNLDFPSKKGLSQAEYKIEYIKLLDDLEALNMNSIIFQIRPRLDAFYKSDINPWSEYLTGKEGLDPGWDPLEWMIEETHSRAMEFQAWFNPYRVTTTKDDKKTKGEQLMGLSPSNWARQNPENVFRFDGRLYLNPGNPEVIDHVNKSIMEVVENYDVDAIHLDDYFYPNKSIKEKEKPYSDEEKISFEKYGKDFKNLPDWRRSNTDKLVYTLNTSIKSYNKENKKSVQFGISPFGIWGHKENHPDGSKNGTGSLTPITSQSSYDNQFADTRKWVKNNWIDYIAPQIYWTFDQKAAPYGELVNWWADVVKDTDAQLYIGHASYKKWDINNKELAWKNPREIANQLKFNSLYDEVKGSIFFRYKSLLKNEEIDTVNNEFIDILLNEHFNNISTIPPRPSLSHSEVESPFGLSVNKSDQGNILTWEDSLDNKSAYYIIYREEISEGSVKSERSIVKRIPRADNGIYLTFMDEKVDPSKNYIYSITAMDRAYNESKPCN